MKITEAVDDYAGSRTIRYSVAAGNVGQRYLSSNDQDATRILLPQQRYTVGEPSGVSLWSSWRPTVQIRHWRHPVMLIVGMLVPRPFEPLSFPAMSIRK